MARQNVIYTEAWCLRDNSLELGCTRYEETSINISSQWPVRDNDKRVYEIEFFAEVVFPFLSWPSD